MKKYILILLLTVAGYGQTLQNPTFGNTTTNTLKIKTNTESATGTNKIPVQETDGTVNWIQSINIPIPYIPTGYLPTAPNIGGHFTGINNKLNSIVATTAGITTRVWFTADVSVVSATNYYATNATSKGTLASAIQNVVNNDNVKTYFAQDLIGAPFVTATLFPPGIYSGNLSASTSPNSAQQRWTVELYKCDNAGTPISSGVTGAPVGSLGVTVITILDSGLLTLVDGSVTNVQVSGNLGGTGLSMAVGERVRYHVSAEKVGTAGANITQSVYYGTSYNSYIDVPVPLNTTAVQNLSAVVGTTTTDALNTLNTGKISGTGTTGQVSFWNGTNTQTGDSNLFWDNTNKRLGIGTSSPLNPLDIVSSGVKVASFLDTGRLELYNSNGDGAVQVLYNLATPVVNQSTGHYAWAAKNSVGNVNTTAFVNSWVTDATETAMNSAMSISIMADKNTSVGYSQPNLSITFDKNNVSIPNGLVVTNGAFFNSTIDVTGSANFRSNLRTLNKAGSAFINFGTRNTAGSETVIDLLNIGTFSNSGSATIGGAMDLTGIASLRNTLRFLNKAGNGFVNFAVRNTTGSETVLDLDNIGIAKVVTVPTTSAGTYDFLTRNTSTFVLEKIPSANVAMVASPIFTGNPIAPTPTAGDNDTSVATTAFVTGAVAAAGTMQATYNNSVSPQITTTTGLGPVTIRRGSASDTDIILRGQTNAGTTSFSVTGSGNITGGSGTYSSVVSASVFQLPNNGTLVCDGDGTDYWKGIRGDKWTTDIKVEAVGFIATGGTVRLKNYTVATLPTGTQGDTAFVTDATAPTYLGALTGGGSVVCPVFYNGVAWVSY